MILENEYGEHVKGCRPRVPEENRFMSPKKELKIESKSLEPVR
jgi:hypothetical protein